MNPGSTMRPPASTISVSAESARSISARGPTAAMRPSRMCSAPSAMMARERMAGPERAPGGPARVTSWRQWRMARSVMGGKRLVQRRDAENAEEAQSPMPRRTSVVEWDGQPGRMPPRMGAWQPERLRYGAATKNQRVAERFPEREARTSWRDGRGRYSSQGLQTRSHGALKGGVLDGIQVDVDVFQRAGTGRGRQGFGHGEIAGESGGDLEGVEALLHGVDPLHHLKGHNGRAVERLLDKGSALGFGALVGEHHQVESAGVAIHGRGEEAAVVLESIARQFGEARHHGTEGGGHGCGGRRGAAAAWGGTRRSQHVEKFGQSAARGERTGDAVFQHELGAEVLVAQEVFGGEFDGLAGNQSDDFAAGH